MQVTVVERTIVEAEVKLTGDDIQQCFSAPYEFAESMQERLRPLLPTAETIGQNGKARHKPKPHQHITIGKGAATRKRVGRRPSAAPKAAMGAKPFKCDNCGEMFAREGNLRRHQVKEHGQPTGSTPPATAAAAA